MSSRGAERAQEELKRSHMKHLSAGYRLITAMACIVMLATRLVGGQVEDVVAQAAGITNAASPLGTTSAASAANTKSVATVAASAQQVAIGQSHTCALTLSGGVKCWGSNAYGRLGDGSTSLYSATPVDVLGLTSDVKAIAAGWASTCALLSDGTVKCWGLNSSGQLGNGTLTPSSVPVLVSGFAGVTMVAIGVGYAHACALTINGHLACWGGNSFSQLGDGTTNTHSTPVEVTSGIATVTRMALGSYHTCVSLTGSNPIKCWGRADYGQTGDGAASPPLTRPLPTDVLGLTSSDVVELAAGLNHTCARLTTGGMKCWGWNALGQLGDSTYTGRTAPVNVLDLTESVVSMAAGDQHTCATTASGKAECWGDNRHGQLGDNQTEDYRTAPGDVSGIDAAVHVAAGADQTCSVSRLGQLTCWGYNPFGQIGDGKAGSSASPVSVAGLGSNVVQITVGASHACALLSDKTIKCWGWGVLGALGDGKAHSVMTPVPVTGFGGLSTVAITAGRLHSCARALSVELGVILLYCWGSNDFGQLGDGGNTARLIPTLISTGGSTMSTWGFHTCVSLYSGGMLCWGRNAEGQIGIGTISATPEYLSQVVQGLAGSVTSIGTGLNHTCAVLVSGALECWGENTDGQLGDGTTVTRSLPVNVTGLTSGVKAVVPGIYHTCALMQTGGIKCWGYNAYGALGNGTAINSLTPVDVIGLTEPAIAIAVGDFHTCALMQSGGMKCWGQSTYGALGSGEYGSHYAPTDVVGLGSGVTSIAANANNTCAVHNGAAKCWGPNDWGQLGDGNAWRTLPVTVMGFEGASAAYPGDAFEPDDTCVQAKPIATDGTTQSHTFHRSGNEDWVSFNAAISTTYVIEGQVPPESQANLVLELRSQCNGQPTSPPNLAFSSGARMVFTTTVAGPVYLRWLNDPPGLFGQGLTYQISVRAIMQPPPIQPGQKDNALIIAAGRLKAGDALQPNIEGMAFSMRQAFVNHGYAPAQIQLLSTAYGSGAPSASNVTGPATVAALQAALTQWAKDRVPPGGMLTLYLVDHGERNVLYLDKLSGESIAPAQLSAWLDQLEQAVPGIRINVILEACYSGSFITPADPSNVAATISKPGRVVIASTGGDELAYATAGGAVFTDHFVQALIGGSTFFTSFEYARWAAQVTSRGQVAWLDDNGDRLPNGVNDGREAAKRGFDQIDPATFDDLPPHIESVHVLATTIAATGARDIQARVVDDKGVSKVWAAIYPPSYVSPQNQAELVTSSVPTVTLTPQSNNDFDLRYDHFDQMGVYRIVVYAVDGFNHVAQPLEVNVQIGRPTYLPLVNR